MFTTTNPATGATVADHEAHDDRAVEDRLARAAETFDAWRDERIEDRTTLAARLADALRADADRYAALITREMGKPITQARAEIEKCAWLCEYYAERAPEQLQDERIGTEPGARTFVTYEPLGPVVAVMPWNYPFWQVFRFAVPALTAGNVAVCKHSPTTMGCGEAIAEVFAEAGYPAGAFQTLRVETDRVADVIADDRVAAVTLTGSTAAGRSVASVAGRELKKTVLELGGSDPYVVLDDADV
ncbi:MAG: aldehyde dehydrogenase family protein, partial [Halobaculum sp.]